MSENKPKYLAGIPTDNRAGIYGQNVWGVITEDGRLILEVRLDEQIGFTESNNRKYASAPKKELVKQEPEADEDLDRILNLAVYQKRKCLYCGKNIKKDEAGRHLDRDVHDTCWPSYLEAHPELKQPKEEEIDE